MVRDGRGVHDICSMCHTLIIYASHLQALNLSEGYTPVKSQSYVPRFIHWTRIDLTVKITPQSKEYIGIMDHITVRKLSVTTVPEHNTHLIIFRPTRRKIN